jgi:hypothetical protein
MQLDHNCGRQLQLMAAGCLLFAVPFHPVKAEVSFQRQSSASHQRLLVLLVLVPSVPSADAPASKYGTVRYRTFTG